MPGFDVTGPMGMGPLTGRGMGFCTVPYSGYAPYPASYGYPYRPYFFPRMGRGRDMGRGRGRGRW